MTLLRALLFIAAAMLVGACSDRDDGGGGTDGGGGGMDSGGGPGDGGEPGDGGPGDLDGASGEDGGEPLRDAGPVDAGRTDAGRDAGARDAGTGMRVPSTDRCAREIGTCVTDADCMPGGGCGGEMCYARTSEPPVSTCDCTAPSGAACGCLDGMCGWYVTSGAK